MTPRVCARGTATIATRRPLAPIARWVHVALGGAAIAAAPYLIDGPAAATTLVIASIIYVAWTAHRTAGLLVALAAGLIEVTRHAARPGDPTPWLWLAAYLVIAGLTSLVEAATRPAGALPSARAPRDVVPNACRAVRRAYLLHPRSRRPAPRRTFPTCSRNRTPPTRCAGYCSRSPRAVAGRPRDRSCTSGADTPEASTSRTMLEAADEINSRRFFDVNELAVVRAQIERAGYHTALSRVVLEVALPGVPDFYQGIELWEHSLVNADNRRAVDFALRMALQAALRHEADLDPAALVARLRASITDGRIEMFMELS